jgi:two-component system LytT family response regulator
MTYRRDLLNIRVVVRPAQGLDAAVDAPARRVQAAASLAVSPQPTPHVTQPAMRPVSATDHGASREVILVKTALKQVAVRLIEITVVEAARNYVRIHLEGGTVLKSRVPISLFARHLSPDRFLRIHRGCLVNVDRIKAVSPIVGGRLALTLNNGARVIVARDRRRVVLAELGRTTVAAGSP